MLDTDVASYIIRDPSVVASSMLATIAPRFVCISSVTRGELRFGLARNPGAVRLSTAVHAFLAGIETLPWDDQAADRYGAVRADLEGRGRPIGALDEMTAAHALSLDATLVTGNTRHFSRVNGLRVTAWRDA